MVRRANPAERYHAAETASLTVLHYDADFDHISAVTGDVIAHCG